MKIYFSLSVDPRVLKDNLQTYKSYFKLWKASGGQLRWNDIFHGKYRIIIPLSGNSVQKAVEEELSKINAILLSYKENKAKDKYGREVKISKLLKGDLLQKYNADPLRQGGDQATNTTNEGKVVVISRHPIDVVSMSTGASWTSCMTLGHKTYIPITKGLKKYAPGDTVKPGSYTEYLSDDIKEGTIVAYVVAEQDIKTLSNPYCRIAIKPFYNASDPTDFILVPEEGTYGNYVAGFREVVVNWLEKNFQAAGDMYLKNKHVYNDESAIIYTKKKFASVSDLVKHARTNKNVKVIFHEGNIAVIKVLKDVEIYTTYYYRDKINQSLNKDNNYYIFFSGLDKKFILSDGKNSYHIVANTFDMEKASIGESTHTIYSIGYTELYYALNNLFNSKKLRNLFHCNPPEEMSLVEVKKFIKFITDVKMMELYNKGIRKFPMGRGRYKLKYADWLKINSVWWLANKQAVLEE